MERSRGDWERPGREHSGWRRPNDEARDERRRDGGYDERGGSRSFGGGQDPGTRRQAGGEYERDDFDQVDRGESGQQERFGGRSPYAGGFAEDQDDGRRGRESRGDFAGQQQGSRGRGWTYTEVWLIAGPHTGRGPKGYRRSDERLQEEVSSRLEHHGEVDASEIEVKVEDGTVTLEGKVDDRRTKRLAEECAESVPGVRDVMNCLKIERGFFENLLGGPSDSQELETGRSRTARRQQSGSSAGASS